MKEKLKKRLNNNKGITLIALVVTIIILLILAAVSLSLVFDSDGLLSKANSAAAKWNQAKEEEEEYLSRISNELEKYNGIYEGGTPTPTPIEDGVIKHINTPEGLKEVYTKAIYGSDVLGYTCERTDVEWQLFYIDEKKDETTGAVTESKVYLIAKDYVVPPVQNATPTLLEGTNEKYPKAYRFGTSQRKPPTTRKLYRSYTRYTIYTKILK